MVEKITKKITKEEEFSLLSKPMPIIQNTNYSIISEITAKDGLPFSSQFLVIIIKDNQKELNRFIRWINFDNVPTKYEIIFNSQNASYAHVGITANKNTPVKSNMKIEMINPNLLQLQERKDNPELSFDERNKFEVPILPSLTPEQENLLEKKIVWIFSEGRSGSTWLGRQLLKHKENILWFEPSLGDLLNLFNIMGIETGMVITGKPYQRGQDNPEYFFSPQHKNNWLPALRKLILTRTYSFSQTFSKNIIIKDPTVGSSSEIISECLSNSKIIFLVRDGRNVVDSKLDMHKEDSWSRKRGKNLEPLSSQDSRERMIRFYSSKWNVGTEKISEACENHHPSKRFFLKYEDLKSNTFEILQKLYDFIGIEISEDEIKKIVNRYDFNKIPSTEKGSGKFFRTAALKEWEKNFSQDEINLMHSIMGNTLKKFGYSV